MELSYYVAEHSIILYTFNDVLYAHCTHCGVTFDPFFSLREITPKAVWYSYDTCYVTLAT